MTAKALKRVLPCRGFTLIEVVVASVLATILLAALLSATATLSRDRQAVAKANASPTPADVRAVFDLLRRDLMQARSFSVSGEGRSVRIVGHCGLARDTMTGMSRPAEVTYQIVSSSRDGDAAGCLIRTQRLTDDPTQPGAWSELVAVDVLRLDINAAATETGIPTQVRATLVLKSRVIDTDLWLR